MRFTKSRTHSARFRTSSACAGSALTLGIAMNSRSSSTQVCVHGRRVYVPTKLHDASRPCSDVPPAGDARRAAAKIAAKRQTSFFLMSEVFSSDVAKLDRVGEGAKLLQALVLDLPDPLAGDVERPADLVERPRMLAVEAVAQLEHRRSRLRERAEDLAAASPCAS